MNHRMKRNPNCPPVLNHWIKQNPSCPHMNEPLDQSKPLIVHQWSSEALIVHRHWPIGSSETLIVHYCWTFESSYIDSFPPVLNHSIKRNPPLSTSAYLVECTESLAQLLLCVFLIRLPAHHHQKLVEVDRPAAWRVKRTNATDTLCCHGMMKRGKHCA